MNTTDTTISEKFSENTQIKRGRPCLYPKIHDGERRTRKSEINQWLVANVFTVIDPLPDREKYAWLMSINNQKRSACTYKRNTILYELGRFPDDKIIEIATWLCDEKPPLQLALKTMRIYRKQLRGD